MVLLLGFGNLSGWYSYFFGTIIRHTRVFLFDQQSLRCIVNCELARAMIANRDLAVWDHGCDMTRLITHR